MACVWRASDGTRVTIIPGDATQAAFSADSSELAFIQGNSVQIYDLASRTIVHSFSVQDAKEGFLSLAWSPDGKFLAAAGHDTYLLDASSGAVLATYRPASGTWIEHLAWSPDSTMLAGEAYILNNPVAFVSAWRVIG
jgi:WD40 repeat protein